MALVEAGRFTRRGGIELLEWPSLGAGVEVVATTRAGGVSVGPYATMNLGLHVGDRHASVVENRRRAAGALDAALSDLVFVNQVHSNAVAVVRAGDAVRGAESVESCLAAADAMVTTSRSVVLAVLSADCVPVVLVDPVAGVLGCAHAGWRGTVAGVAAATVHAMEELGARPDRLLGAFGPAIDRGRYQVGPEVAALVVECLPRCHGDVLAPDGTGRWLFDLVAANRAILAEVGVRDSHLAGSPVGTGGGGPFFSDRDVRPCGRQGLLARLTA